MKRLDGDTRNVMYGLGRVDAMKGRAYLHSLEARHSAYRSDYDGGWRYGRAMLDHLRGRTATEKLRDDLLTVNESGVMMRLAMMVFDWLELKGKKEG